LNGGQQSVAAPPKSQKTTSKSLSVEGNFQSWKKIRVKERIEKLVTSNDKTGNPAASLMCQEHSRTTRNYCNANCPQAGKLAGALYL